MKSTIWRKLFIFFAFIMLPCLWLNCGEAQERKGKSFVGSEACKSCHEKEYASFERNSKKARSYESIVLMKKGLTETEFQGCCACHTAGYGQLGGFRSETETPHLKNAGCESCHGPGSVHVETTESVDIKGKLNAEDCERCHSSQRVEAFRFKPLIFGGAH